MRKEARLVFRRLFGQIASQWGVAAPILRLALVLPASRAGNTSAKRKSGQA